MKPFKLTRTDKKMLEKIGNLEGKTIVITGATGSIAKEFEHYFLHLHAKLILTGRNQNKLKQLYDELMVEFPTARISTVLLDLSDLDTIRNFINTIHEERVDILINAAGTYHLPITIDEKTNLELTFLTNYASPHLLTLKMCELFPQMDVITVGSLSYYFHKLNQKDIYSLRTKDRTKRYSRSKRFIALDSILLQNRCPTNNIYLTQPGISATSLFDSSKGGFSKAFNHLIVPLMKLIFPSPKSVSRAVIMALYFKAKPPYLVGPKHFFHIFGKPTKYKLRRSLLKQEDELRLIASINRNIEQTFKL